MNKSANKTPSVSTIRNMNLQRLALSQKQLSEILLQHEATTLYTDETSIFDNKIGGYHISDKEGNYYTLGLRNLVTKGGSGTLETFKEILKDIDNRSARTENEVSRQILTNIHATISDSAITEIKFNKLLEEYRISVLPYTIEKYEQLDNESKEAVDTLLIFSVAYIHWYILQRLHQNQCKRLKRIYFLKVHL